MERYGRSGEEGSRSDQSPEWTALEGETGIDASMRRLGLRSGGESYPERPDEPDCIYYLRTGSCGYGSRCRFNHPRDRGAVVGAARGDPGEFPERMGQPVCQYFMRTGTCKFGASCKYNHPRQAGGSVTPMSLNYMGYPLRPGEKECSYYMRTGQCKFGATCRFHHPVPPGAQVPVPSPPPAQVSPVAPHAIYPTVQSPSVPSSQQYGVVMARPPLLPGSYVQSPYGPMVLPPGMVPYSGWNPYPASVSAMPSPGTQASVGSGSIYGITPLSPSAPAYTGPYQSGPSSVGPSSSSQKENMFPQRPGQPECQYYLRTGDCKFGSSCRYHHPLVVTAPKTTVILSPIGLPIRPGAPPCSHFAQHGICKFGPACKFDHSLGSLSYSPSASSLTDIPVAPYPVGSSVGTLAPSSSSSSDLRPELISTSTKETSSTKPSSSTSLMSTTVSGPVSAAITSSTTSSSLSEVSSASASVSSSGLEARTSS